MCLSASEIMNSPSCISRIEEKEKKPTNHKAKTQYVPTPPIHLISLPHQSTYSSWLIFPLTFVFCLIKIEKGVFSFLFSDIFGIRSFEEREDDREQVNTEVSLCSRKERCHGRPMAGEIGRWERPGWLTGLEPWTGSCPE